MAEELIFPEWLDIDKDSLAEDIAGLEYSLLQKDKQYTQLYEERSALINTSPALRSVFMAEEPQALTAEDSEKLIRITAIDHQMREITSRVVFLYGRKNAYMFMRSIGQI